MKLLQKLKIIAAAISVFAITSCTTMEQQRAEQSASIHGNTVMITNLAKNHGGTGVVLRSTINQSLVLTNSHVCRVVEQGGLVRGEAGSFMVSAYKHSVKNDLCLIKVDANLRGSTKISEEAPEPFVDEAIVSGHPALMPNVITKGHVSGRQNIAIITGVKPCSPEDLTGPNGLACLFLGGIPVIKNFDSVLVTATIMPGSSGSAVYNSQGQLIGLVFAGSGDLGYAWTVPFESVTDFLGKEAKTLSYKLPTNTVDLSEASSHAGSLDDFFTKLHVACSGSNKDKLDKYCQLEKSNVIWYK